MMRRRQGCDIGVRPMADSKEALLADLKGWKGERLSRGSDPTCSSTTNHLYLVSCMPRQNACCACVVDPDHAHGQRTSTD
jgi:hypothetical protein